MYTKSKDAVIKKPCQLGAMAFAVFAMCAAGLSPVAHAAPSVTITTPAQQAAINPDSDPNGPDAAILNAAKFIESGDVDAALKYFTPTPKNRIALMRMNAKQAENFAGSLRRARLVRDQGTIRQYAIPMTDHRGPVETYVTVGKARSGTWRITNW